MNSSDTDLPAVLKSAISNLRFEIFLESGFCDLELPWSLELGAWSFFLEDRPC